MFYINLPLAAAVIVISLRHVPESRAPGPRKPLDVMGAITISLALAGITYGLIEASESGWTSPPVLTSLLAGVVLFVAFLRVEAGHPNAMLPLSIFRSRQFSAANAVTFVVYGALGGALFLVPVVLQEVCGYSALEAGDGAAADNGHHARPVGQVRRAFREDRPAAADDCRTAGDRRRRWPCSRGCTATGTT